MFRGIVAVNMDAKGRITLPTRFRQRLTDDSEQRLVITIDTSDRCLMMYPLDEWEVIERKLGTLPTFNPAARRIQRLLIGHATEAEVDSSGRVLLPPVLRDYAGLSKKVNLVGQGKKLEIWNEMSWQSGREMWLAEETHHDVLPEELREISL